MERGTTGEKPMNEETPNIVWSKNGYPVIPITKNLFISGSGDKRGHGKTPLLMKYVESQNEPKVKK
jgi:hypothetical protein